MNPCIQFDLPVAWVNNISCFLANSISLLISFNDSSAANNSLSKVGISSFPTRLDGSDPIRARFELKSIPKLIFTGTSPVVVDFKMWEKIRKCSKIHQEIERQKEWMTWRKKEGKIVTSNCSIAITLLRNLIVIKWWISKIYRDVPDI